MTELIAVFRSRAQAIDCNLKLQSMGISSTLIPTPKEAHIGCGLSVRIPKNLEARCRFLIARGGYSAFYGYYTVKKY